MKALCVSLSSGTRYDFRSYVPKPKGNPLNVLVEVWGSSINHMDSFAPQIPPYRLLRNGRPGGFDFAGRVIDTGSQIRHFNVGDRVYGFAPSFCEYTTAYPWLMSRVPDSIEDLSSMACYPSVAGTALQILRKHWLFPRRKVSRLLVIGASGGVGSSIVQLARHYGGRDTHVSAVASGRNSEYCSSLGADQFVDYRKTKGISCAFPAGSFDLIIDTVSGNPGVPNYVPDALSLRSPNGTYVCTNSLNPQDYIRKFTGLQRKGFDLFVMNPFGAASRELPEISRLVESGKLKLRTEQEVPFEDEPLMRAMKHFNERHTQGKMHIRLR
jgi:NADPH:quinone reductase-like Zn-dependent oxidoreductase